MSKDSKVLTRRLIAFIIDLALVTFFVIILTQNSLATGSGLGSLLGTFIISPALVFVDSYGANDYSRLLLIIWLCYSTIFEMLFKATIGKLTMQLRVTYNASLLDRYIESPIRNILKLLPFNTFSYLTPYGCLCDKFIELTVIDKNDEALKNIPASNIKLSELLAPPITTSNTSLKTRPSSATKIEPTFENTLKLLFTGICIFILMNYLPDNTSYDNEFKYDWELKVLRFGGLFIFGILAYRNYAIKQIHIAVAYIVLAIIYQPLFRINNFYELSFLREIIVGAILLISSIRSPYLDKLKDWIKISTTNSNKQKS